VVSCFFEFDRNGIATRATPQRDLFSVQERHVDHRARTHRGELGLDMFSIHRL